MLQSLELQSQTQLVTEQQQKQFSAMKSKGSITERKMY